MYARGEGIVLNEPSVIALNSRSGEVLAMGHEAWQMIGRTPSYIVAVRPLRKGAITDFEVTQRMIRLLLQRVGVSRLNRPRVVICVPSAITAVERRAVTEAARRQAPPMPASSSSPLPPQSVPICRSTNQSATWWSTSGWYHRERPHLARRRRARGGPSRLVRHRQRHSGVRPPRVRHRGRRAHRRGDQDRAGIGLSDRWRGQRRGPRP